MIRIQKIIKKYIENVLQIFQGEMGRSFFANHKFFHHAQKVSEHIQTHHKKYIFGSFITILFLFILSNPHQDSYATSFPFGGNTGTFAINNDNSLVTGTSVTLNITSGGATQMKFGNTPAARDAAPWSGFATTCAWTISNGTEGIKTVYAMFSGGGNIAYTTDKIILSYRYQNLLSGLVWHINAATNGVNSFIDQSSSNYTGDGLGGTVATGSILNEAFMLFTGAPYVERATNLVTAYPFSISAWFRPDSLTTVNQTIVSIATSTAATRYYAIVLSGNRVGVIARNTTETLNFGTTTALSTGSWYHILGVFHSATQRNIFVNGVSELTGGTSVTYNSSANNRRNIGRMADSSPDRFFSGAIDEVRVYNRSLATDGTGRADVYIPIITAEPLTTNSTTPNIYGTIIASASSNVTVTISGTNTNYNQTYADANDGNYKWSLSGTSITTPLNTGTYNLIITTNTPYGKTGSTTFASALVVQDTPTISYSPSGTGLTNQVIATLTGIDSTVLVTNNNFSNSHTFTGNGSFTFQYQDNNGNTGEVTTQTITWIDGDAPVVTTGVISSGTTGSNGGNLYYNGTIDVRSDVSDTGGTELSGGTCQYTLDGLIRTSAVFQTTYCEVSSLTPNADISVQFRIQDTVLNQGTGDIGTYLYDILPPATASWGRKAGGTGADLIRGITLDSSGNAYVVGPFNSTASFGSTTLVSSGLGDIFVGKLSSTGQRLWIAKGGGTSDEYVYTVSVDSGGNSYVAGYFGGTAYFGSTALVSSGGNDVFLGELSSTGQRLWATKGGGSLADLIFGIAIDSGGNSYVGGGFNGTASFGSRSFTSSGTYDAFVGKVSSTGQRVWALKGGGAGGNDVTTEISVDEDGNSYVVGYFNGTASFGSTTFTSSGSSDSFVSKISSTGQRSWVIQEGGVGADQGISIAVDSGGNSYTSIYFSNTVYFGATNFITRGSIDIFAGKLSSTGQRIWGVQGGGAGADLGYGIAIDSGGNSYVGGYFNGTGTFGAITLVSSGSNDIFMGKISSIGQRVWGVKGGGVSDDIGLSVAVDSEGNGYVGGYFSGTASFSDRLAFVTTTFTTSGATDAIITKIDPTFLSINNDDPITSSTSVTLTTPCLTDAGVGGEQVAYGNTASPTNRTTCSTSLAHTLSTGNGAKTVYLRFKDSLGNMTDDITDTITFIAPPTVSTGYISSGTTGTNGGNLYYQGTINIRADVTSGGAVLSEATCQYTTGNSRVTATYTTGYCEVTSLTQVTTINIQFRIQDILGNQGTGNTGTYIFDATAPAGGNFSINTDAASTNSTSVTLTTACATDAGVNGTQVAYGNTASPTNRTTCSASIAHTLDEGAGTKTVYMRFKDSFGNTTDDITDTIVLSSPPTVSTGYISSGTTGSNAGNFYYQGTINVRADVSDGGGGLSGATCEYTTGSSREAATYNTTYCEVTGITPIATVNIQFRIQDILGNQGTGNTGTYIFDATAPAGGSFSINTDAASTNSTSVNLTTACATDAGINGTQVAYGNTASPTNRTTCSASIAHTLSAGDATKTVYMRFKDSFGNTTDDITDTIVLDTTGPTISTGYISNGTTGTNGGNLYYQGTINIRADVSDGGAGLSGATCQYTTGSSRATATYNTTYCEVTSLTQVATVNIQFRIQDQAGNQGTGTTGTYVFDATAPAGGSFTINSNATYATGTSVTLTTTCATDAGVGGEQVAYGNTANPTNRTTCSASIAHTLSAGDATKTVYMRFKDSFGNTTDDITDTIILDTTAPTATVSYDIVGLTSQNVIATVTGFSESVTNQNATEHTFTGNGSFSFTFEDLVGHTGSVTARVTWIYLSFVSVNNASYNSLYTSNVVTVAGYGPGVETGVSITAGTLYKNGIPLGGLSTTGADDDQFYIGLTSSSSPGTTVSSTMTIGITTGIYSVTTISQTFTVGGPTGLDLGNLETPTSTYTVEKTFTGVSDYLSISDFIGNDSGYYTTISLGDLTTQGGAILSNTTVSIKSATGVITVDGSVNANVDSAITGTYVTIGASVLTFIKRDPGVNSSLTGTYAISPALKVLVPALQNAGNYSGTLVFTYYPN